VMPEGGDVIERVSAQLCEPLLCVQTRVGRPSRAAVCVWGGATCAWKPHTRVCVPCRAIHTQIKSYAAEKAPEIVWSERLRAAKKKVRRRRRLRKKPLG
jgi:hypothetical protein